MTDNTPEKPEIYSLDASDLENVSKTLQKLNDLQKESYLETPDRMLVRSFDDWRAIGYVVNIDDGWYFEAITVHEREELGEP